MPNHLPIRPLPCFIRGGQIVWSSNLAQADNHDYHFDLLSFISIAQSFGIDFINITWQPALESLGKGASSTVQQAQMDATFDLAFKRSTSWSGTYTTEQQGVERYKAIIYELIALELLIEHPNVIDLIGITWETDGETEEVWPVLLAERSVYGNMFEFLQSATGRALNSLARLGICADVAKACLAVHSLGEQVTPGCEGSEKLLKRVSKVSSMETSNPKIFSSSRMEKRGPENSSTLALAVLVQQTMIWYRSHAQSRGRHQSMI
jgi:hypothetical protein